MDASLNSSGESLRFDRVGQFLLHVFGLADGEIDPQLHRQLHGRLFPQRLIDVGGLPAVEKDPQEVLRRAAELPKASGR